ncbi:hypothetical protein K505DRAFT_412668 [Melanomma pulvis-pyrius CBS 109.77]|uniref:Uncharacterized protein n=1 Tax=Melanomma pulvis-pyrius CBS 109.77 TaxID=1314802 RepID=A0A6A6XYU8_9PLEO|nr:hypothetical protein K505DRAFT_412668 [Melanomma pulvis-pyrius CBS 109.77]
MAKKPINVVGPEEKGAEGSPRPSVSPRRPGTSGTEILLTTDRRTASARYQAAQRAEQAYKAKKRSAGAAQHRTDAKSHFKQSAHHLKEGTKSSWKIVAAVPWMIRGWRENRLAENEKKARERDLIKKKKLEERIARQVERDLEKEREKEEEAGIQATA